MNIESSDSNAHMLLTNIYASADRWRDATKTRIKMKDVGLRKMPGCSSIEINGIVHEFLVGDASHPQMREIFSILCRMIQPILSGLEW